MVCYEASGSLSNVTINNGSASQQTFTISQVGVPHSVTIVALSSQLPSAAATNTSTVLTAEPPTSLSAVHETPTSIHVYWTTPTGSITGYEITLQSGGNSSSVLVSGGVSDHTIDSGVSSDADYSVSMVSLNSFARSPYTGPVLAARGESLWSNGTYMFWQLKWGCESFYTMWQCYVRGMSVDGVWDRGMPYVWDTILCHAFF